MPTGAQRRPGRTPRRHAVSATDLTPLKSAQRRPGRTPRRHDSRPAASPSRAGALNEGRGAHPGDTVASASRSQSPSPLNEGRGAHPGDTHVVGDPPRLHGPRSTKAGAHTPATLGQVPLDVLEVERSTKAGAHTPATRARWPGRWSPSRSPLNEGRGAHPGDTSALRDKDYITHRRSTKAGAHTPATRDGRAARIPAGLRSTKAGAHTPATPPQCRGCSSLLRSLNEGRGAHPGDTLSGLSSVISPITAQRRPGRTPRRHWWGVNCPTGDRFAQRRPGRTPRRHTHQPRGTGRHRARSTKAGAHTPATPCAASRTRPKQACRSTKAGAHTPATRRSSSRPPTSPWPAQRTPGRTPRRHVSDMMDLCIASGAQRRPGRTPRRHAGLVGQHAPCLQRSTKAGAHTPATRPCRSRCGRCRCPLNEGRGAHPGDTPRRRCGQDPSVLRSTKAGAHTPATLPVLMSGSKASGRSTKAGAHTPATRPHRRRYRRRSRSVVRRHGKLTPWRH